jgi:H+/Cl- antiporter ClcA
MQSLAGGVVLGLLGAASGIVLFSGHTRIQDLIDDDVSNTPGFLMSIAGPRRSPLRRSWLPDGREGRFFPIMFAGAAAGLAVSHVLRGLVPVVALAAGMSAAVAGLIRKPIAAMVLPAFLFPPALYGVVVLVSAVGALAATALARISAGLPARATATDVPVPPREPGRGAGPRGGGGP